MRRNARRSLGEDAGSENRKMVCGCVNRIREVRS